MSFCYLQIMGNFIDLTGRVYGKLTVISFYGMINKGSHWLCKCTCGRLCTPRGSSLTFGSSKSCGDCIHETHGMSKSKEFSSWTSMINRCYNHNNDNYYRYGGRGITVCNRWVSSFENFFLDMGHAPSSKHSIDRKNNDGNYELLNCRWATVKEQSNNTSRNLFIEYKGQTKTLTQWCDLLLMNWNTIKSRLKKGWSVEYSFTKPIDISRRRKITKPQ